MSSHPRYSIVLPTYRRPDVLAKCLEHLVAADYSREMLEVVVLDNGGSENSRALAAPFESQISLQYVVNEQNLGYGGSVNKGLRLGSGDRIVILNDDALVPQDFFTRIDAVLDSDPSIGCVGCRALEQGYVRLGVGVGRITDTGEVVANFDMSGDRAVDVEHVYGFCYVITREALNRVGVYDEVLLARAYSTGDRIETDHCLSIREAGLRVVYDPRIAVVHLAKPRGDISERSLKWKLNHTRNTLYLFLKHYGLFGRRCLTLRFTLFHDVGVLSVVRQPSAGNLAYFLAGLRARLSAYGHYALYWLQCGSRRSDRAAVVQNIGRSSI
jgi:GT2 family glycosyltransferase